MGVVNKLSPQITNMDSAPIVGNDARSYGGRLRRYIGGPIAFAAADDDTSNVRMIRLKSNSVLVSLKLYNDVITAGSSSSFGLYYEPTKLLGVVVPNCIALFATNVDMQVAHSATGPLEILYQTTAANFSVMTKKLWDLAGLTTDPDCYFDIMMTANTIGSGTGNIMLVADVL